MYQYVSSLSTNSLCLILFIVADTQPIVSAQVRLISSSSSSSEGRVEVHYNGKWGTICFNGFDFLDALVICRQLSKSMNSNSELQ